ncbi:hypothetical protein CWB58_03720 [Pseudoalteromonas sp. S201]|nr:hypothetical protein CWB81_10305 [Pseudoalteromonas sp. S1688]TMS94504.1 hypothetical protein CWB58_03720 [Pseudoalteromonas sp. S201]
MWHLRIKSEFESLLGGAFGLTNLHFDIGRISGGATPSDKNNEFTRNNPTYHVSDINNCFIQ